MSQGLARPAAGGISRRGFLAGSVSTLGVGVGLGASAPSAAAATGDLLPLSMAMHLHASFSEGTASLHSHLQQAALHGVDVVWWTEHDHRLQGHLYRRVVHFDGASEPEDGLSWTWARTTSGSPATAVATWVTDPVSPSDPTVGALRMETVSSQTWWSSMTMTGTPQNSLIRTSVDGQRLLLDVLPLAWGTDAYVGLRVGLSHHPASGGRAAGRYSVTYRIGGDVRAGRAVARNRDGIISLPAAEGAWTTIEADLAADIARLWPDLQAADNSTCDVAVVTAARRGARVEAVVDHLRFVRERKDGAAVLAVQAGLMAAYGPQYPGVTQHQGAELSLYREHLNWYGGSIALPDISALTMSGDNSDLAMHSAVAQIHAAGGLAQYNHPFGSGSGGALSQTAQATARRTLATRLLTQGIYGADLMEVGYVVRGGVDLAGHVATWDTLSRNGVMVTGTGVSDDHAGTNWMGQKLNFLTWVWAPDTSLDELTAALASGRAWFGDPLSFGGQLDLLVDGVVPMGSAGTSWAAQRTVTVLATGLPAGSVVEVVQGVVDLAGPAAPDPLVDVVATIPAPATGSAEVVVSTKVSSFVRAVVRTSTGQAVAFTNPVWLLRPNAPVTVPAARRV